jgi:hypothetical protein
LRIQRSAVSVNDNIVGDLDSSPISSGFRTPSANDSRCVVKRCAGATGDTFTETDNAADYVATNRANASAQSLANCRAGLIAIGDSHAVGVRGAAKDKYRAKCNEQLEERILFHKN